MTLKLSLFTVNFLSNLCFEIVSTFLCMQTVADPGGGKGAMASSGPVKFSLKKDGCLRQPHRFLGPPTLPLDLPCCVFLFPGKLILVPFPLNREKVRLLISGNELSRLSLAVADPRGRSRRTPPPWTKIFSITCKFS